MSRKIDLTGQVFGYLTVLEPDDSPGNKRTKWICVCKCGNSVSVFTYHLNNGKTTSCGCKRYETKNQTHGMRHTRIYEIWCGMKSRCYNTDKKSYAKYGARGITVCDEWKNNFEAFYEWAISNGYEADLSIDRIDPNKEYCPSNCRWITHAEQQRNRTNNIFVEHNGETKTLSEWCRIMNEPYAKIHSRMKSCLYHCGKYDFDDLFSPKKHERIYTEKYYNRNHFHKRIGQYTADGKLVKYWESTVEAESDGFNKTAITNCLRGRSKTSGGYVWRYAEE